jgi:putative acetyltransferase
LIGGNDPPAHAMPERDEITIAGADKRDVGILLEKANDLSWNHKGPRARSAGVLCLTDRDTDGFTMLLGGYYGSAEDEVTMSVVIRPMREDEAKSFLLIQRASVRGLAANDYPPSVIETWAPLPVTETAVAFFRVNHDNEIRLVAEMDGELVGIAALVTADSELRACYVLPAAARRGVGSALVAEIERIARDHGLTHLELLSSLTAEPFYRRLGYEAEDRVEHVFGSGRERMAAVKMRKTVEARGAPPGVS